MCKTQVSIRIEELSRHIPIELIRKNFGQDQEIKTFKGSGCKICHFTGYSGRIGVFEILLVSKEIRKLITAKNDSDVIRDKAVEEGMTTMLDDGLQKTLKGLTTIEEILRVTRIESA